MYCTRCQSEDPRPRAIFCKTCGFRLVASGPAIGQEPASNTKNKAEAKAAATENHCQKCGALVSVGRRYCAACCGVPDNPVRSKQDVTGTAVAAGQAKPTAQKPASPAKTTPESEPPAKAASGPAADSAQAAIPPAAPAKPTGKKRPQKPLPVSGERPAAAAASPEAPVQTRENQPAGRIPDPEPEPAFEPVPPPIGPALGLLDDDPLPELPRKRPRRHFQHWGLLMITILLTLAALAAGGYYAALFEKASGTQAQSSALDEHRTELRLPPAMMEQPQATPLQATSLYNPVAQPVSSSAVQAPLPENELREQPILKPDRAAAQTSRAEAKAAKQKAVKHEGARQKVAAKKPASRLASQELKKSPPAKPYSAPRANPASRVASPPKPEQAARVAPSPAPQPSAMALEEHDPLYLHRKEQELDSLLQQLQ